MCTWDKYVVIGISNISYLLWWGKKGNALFNGALNTFYLQLNEIRYKVKDHTDKVSNEWFI